MMDNNKSGWVDGLPDETLKTSLESDPSLLHAITYATDVSVLERLRDESDARCRAEGAEAEEEGMMMGGGGPSSGRGGGGRLYGDAEYDALRGEEEEEMDEEDRDFVVDDDDEEEEEERGEERGRGGATRRRRRVGARDG